MPEYKKIGTGITEREIESWSFHEFASPQEFVEAMNRQLNGAGVEQMLSSLEGGCSSVLRKAGLPDHDAAFVKKPSGWKVVGSSAPIPKLLYSRLEHIVIKHEGNEIDSDVGYAARMLVHIKDLRRSKEKHEIDNVAKYALRIGSLWTEWQMKLKWEKPALRGRKQMGNWEHISRQNAQAQHEASEVEFAPAIEMAENFWSRNSGLSATRVAELIKGALNLPQTVGRIAKRIAIVRPPRRVRRK